MRAKTWGKYCARRAWAAVAVVLVGVIGTTANAESIEEPEQVSFTGTYVLDEEASDDIEEAFEPVIQQMSGIKRPFARRAVRRRGGPDQQLRIVQFSDQVIIEAREDSVVEVPLNGEAVERENGSGDIEEVSARLEDGVLSTRTVRDEGEYTTRYRLRSDGRLEVSLRIAFDQLPGPVDLNLVYEPE